MNVVITGANRGIGLAMTQQFVTAGHRVYGLCRNVSDALADSGATVIDGVDVGNPDTLPGSLSALKDVSIDLLINNAGVLANERIDEWQPNTIDYQFRVNAMGPLLVTQCLLENLQAGAKVALITSRMGSMADNGSGGYYGYRMSKAALNAAGVSMARDLAPRGVAVGLFHPGFVQTDMVGGQGDVDAATAASRLIARIEALSVETAGKFIHANGEELPW
ncbi:MAG: SDR family oxidoreductase [Aestuariibacter sp.]|uniref:SDR family oxidoreductase n=1 Tax=Marisediminitalea aggregata TaxID=634436 RepID=UPI0020CDA071|nr:SDR family oxidoreductase [Marisediminitalea aggregata]MCP3863255.1 SDR family oxidoreductase [Aestuariibacter sp.]MCP4527303.1 SDR family oxidoreductase [Aestuariibacter sp.]MCP9479911.1 SDR family oxidoreductase [Marisediminitalea aggregata]